MNAAEVISKLYPHQKLETFLNVFGQQYLRPGIPVYPLSPMAISITPENVRKPWFF